MIRLPSRLLTFALMLGYAVTATPAPPSLQLNQPDVRDQPWRITPFPELDGVGFRCFAEDAEGNIWFGVRDGVLRYDGYRWNRYSESDGLPAGEVRWLVCRGSGVMVAANSRGFYEYEDGRWRELFAVPDSADLDLSYVIESPGGDLWACCGWGLLKITDGRSMLLTDRASQPIAIETGWFDRVRSWPNPCVPYQKHDNGIDARLLGNALTSIEPGGPADEAGVEVGDQVLSVNGNTSNLLQATRQPPGAVLTMELLRGAGDVRSVELVTREPEGASRSPATNSVMIDSQGRIWVGMRVGGVLVSEDDGKNWRSLKKEGLTTGGRVFLLETSDHSIWSISSGRKANVARFTGETWETEDLQLLSSTHSLSMAAQSHDGLLWAASLEAVFVRPNGKWWRLDKLQSRLPSAGHRMMVTSDRALWLGGHDQSVVRISLGEREFLSLGQMRYLCSESHASAPRASLRSRRPAFRGQRWYSVKPRCDGCRSRCGGRRDGKTQRCRGDFDL